jgi:hypothetical protein
MYGDLAVVNRLLMGATVDPTADDNDAIRMASCRGQLAVVERLLQDERVDPAAGNNDAIRSASFFGQWAVVERLLTDTRVDAAALHRSRVINNIPVSALTDAMLPRLAAELSLPFPASSCIWLWQPRLREYRHEQMQFLERLIASWRWHGGGLCRDIVENLVSEYVLGGLKVREYAAMDAGYVRPPPLLTDPSVSSEDDDYEDVEDDDDAYDDTAAAAAAVSVNRGNKRYK